MYFSLLPLLIFQMGCAVLHHVQVGNIDDRKDHTLVPFEILLTETGVNIQEIGDIAKSTNTHAGDNAGGIADIIGLFQVGPRTGNPIYNEKFAERLIYEMHQRCPSGQITGLMSIREHAKYPVVSGEIVKVKGYCRQSRATKGRS